jgi:elongation factor G
MSDPYVGKLTYFRVYSGKLKSGDRVYNTTTGKTERDRPHPPDAREPPRGARRDRRRRDRGGVGLKQTTTGDTLSAESQPIVLESMTFPEPVISVAVEPKSKADQDKLGAGLARLAEEDPTFRVTSDEETGQTLIAGMGELHLEIIVDRLMREFNVAPTSAARRSPTARRSRGRREGPRQVRPPDRRLGPVRRRARSTCSPQEPGEGYEFEDKIVGGKIPKEYIPAVDAGIEGGDGLRRARRLPRRRRQGRAHRRLLPRRRLERARVQDRRLDGVQGRDEAGEADPARADDVGRGHDTRGLPRRRDGQPQLATRAHRIDGRRSATRRSSSASVPLSEMFGYATDLRSMSQGRATFTMQFERYEEVPASIAAEITRAAEAPKTVSFN